MYMYKGSVLYLVESESAIIDAALSIASNPDCSFSVVSVVAGVSVLAAVCSNIDYKERT